jgi:hypothetical protein
MPSYHEWNTALIEHATHGAPLGSTVYLEVSEETLIRIGTQRWGAPEKYPTWQEDFLAAVRFNSVREDHLYCDWMVASDAKQRPLGVAFLGSMVLAASNMARDSAGLVHETNYFKRLADVLGVRVGTQGRPLGLLAGAEEPLWRVWLAYLRSKGLESSAVPGSGSRRFINYPISQSLIPEAEKQRLQRLFQEHHYPATLDGELLASRLRADAGGSQKLRELLARTGMAAEDVQTALLEVFQGFHASGGSEHTAEGRGGLGTRQLLAGLYRTEHWRTGEPQYLLFPRQPRGIRLADLTVHFPSGNETLGIERPGYYRPLGEVSPSGLTTGQKFEVTGSPFLDALVLPAREYWLLRHDPDAQGQYASLGMPNVGEHLLLLVRDRLLPDLERFQEMGLLAWTGRPVPLGEGWLELRDLMVIGNHWDEVPSGLADALHQALRPPEGVSVHLSGGARAQRAGAYLAGAAPTIRVMSFWQEAHLTVTCDEDVLFDSSVTPGEDLELPLSNPGLYELVAESRGVRAVRTLTVVEWDELRAAPTGQARMAGTEVNGCRIWGAHVYRL